MPRTRITASLSRGLAGHGRGAAGAARPASATGAAGSSSGSSFTTPGRHLAQHLARGKPAVSQRGIQVFRLAVAVFAGHPVQVGLADPAHLHAQAARLLFQVLLADLDGLQPLAGVDQVLDLVARARGLDEGQPVLAGLVTRLGHDLDDVAVAQRGAQRHDAPVHLGADAGVADVGVDGVGEIDGRGVARQHDHFAARREGVDLFGVQVHLERGHELAGVLHVALPFHQVAQPGDPLVVGRRTLAALLVFPVRRDPLFGDAVHLLGADLHFERLPVRAHHGGMQGLVEVGPRNGDEIFDAAREWDATCYG